jgi:hypothetical protein
MPNYEIVNKKSGAKSVVTEAEWLMIKDKGMAKRFTFKMQSAVAKKPPFEPKEVVDMRNKKDASKDKESDSENKTTDKKTNLS